VLGSLQTSQSLLGLLLFDFCGVVIEFLDVGAIDALCEDRSEGFRLARCFTNKIFGPNMRPHTAVVETKIIPHQMKYNAAMFSCTNMSNGTPIIVV